MVEEGEPQQMVRCLSNLSLAVNLEANANDAEQELILNKTRAFCLIVYSSILKVGGYAPRR